MVASLEGLAPFQVGFVVSDLERAVRAFDTQLAAGPWRSWIFGPQGQGREYHGHVVPSLERTTAEMESAGHPVVARIHSFGRADDGAAAYYDTAEALGFLVEAVEPPSEMPPADLML